MYTRILVPLDGSARAEAALPCAEALARSAGGTLDLVRADRPGQHDAAVYLQAVATRARAGGLTVATWAEAGPPGSAVVAVARQRGTDLIVLTTHGESGPGGWMLGSVTDEILHRTAIPLLLLRSGQPALADRPRRILVPLDGSELAERAVPEALGMLDPAGELVLYQAVPLPAHLDAGPTASPGLPAPCQDAAMLPNPCIDALAYLERVAAGPRRAGYHVRTAADCATPAGGILAHARAAGVDLIVLSGHGRAGVARWQLGSVADELLRQVTPPLLLLRPLLATVEPPAPTVAAALASADAVPASALTIDPAEAQLLRLALDTLLADPIHGAPREAAIRALLARLPTAVMI